LDVPGKGGSKTLETMRGEGTKQDFSPEKERRGGLLNRTGKGKKTELPLPPEMEFDANRFLIKGEGMVFTPRKRTTRTKTQIK